jgi:hypothetical protein
VTFRVTEYEAGTKVRNDQVGFRMEDGRRKQGSPRGNVERVYCCNVVLKFPCDHGNKKPCDEDEGRGQSRGTEPALALAKAACTFPHLPGFADLQILGTPETVKTILVTHCIHAVVSGLRSPHSPVSVPNARALHYMSKD